MQVPEQSVEKSFDYEILAKAMCKHMLGLEYKEIESLEEVSVTASFVFQKGSPEAAAFKRYYEEEFFNISD